MNFDNPSNDLSVSCHESRIEYYGRKLFCLLSGLILMVIIIVSHLIRASRYIWIYGYHLKETADQI